METPQYEDRQRNERGAIGARNDVGRRGQLADVKFNLPDHAPEGCDLRLDRDDFGIDPYDGNGAVSHGGGVWVVGHSDLETNFASQVRIPLLLTATMPNISGADAIRN